MSGTPIPDPSADSSVPTDKSRVFEFPDRGEQLGTPPLIGVLWDGKPFMMCEAVGEASYPDTDPRVLEFRSHVVGQAEMFLTSTEDSTVPPVPLYSDSNPYWQLIIRAGKVGTDDLRRISLFDIPELVLGWERGTEGHGVEPLTFVDRPDLSELDTLDSLEVNAIEFTDGHLATLGSVQRLTSLLLTGADVSAGTLAKCVRIRVLHLDDPHLLGTDLGFLPWMSTLSVLGIRFSDIGQPQLPVIAAHRGIRVLDIAYNAQMGPDLSGLAAASELIILDASGTGADDTTLGPLGALTSLEVLNLQCTKLTDEGLGALGSFGRVTKLNVAGNRISDDGLSRIVDAMPQLAKLDIRATDVTPDGAMVLGRLRNLRTLGLSGSVLTARLAEHLADETSLAQVDLCPPFPDMDEETEAVDIIGSARYIGGPA